MKINVEQRLRNLEGEFFKEQDGVTDLTLGRVLIRSLVLSHPSDDKQLSGDEKFALYQLAEKLTKPDNEFMVDVKPEEIVILKRRVGMMYNTVIVGPVYTILNG